MSLDHIPATVCRYDVSASVLRETWAFVRERGRLGLEGVALWIGNVLEPTHAVVLAAVQPHQIAHRGPEGLSVEVPQDALTEMIATLPDDVHVLVRLHSHAGEAYHSRVDDANMLIAHEGAVSIVIPDFGAGRADLTRCSVNVLSAADGWRELSKNAIAKRFHIT